jgi:hypothetical protein
MFDKVTSVFFRKPVDPKDLVRKWQSELRSEQRGMERQIRDLAREEKLAQKNVRRGGFLFSFGMLFGSLTSRREEKKLNVDPLDIQKKLHELNRSATPPSAATPPEPRPSPARSSAVALPPPGCTFTRPGSWR